MVVVAVKCLMQEAGSVNDLQLLASRIQKPSDLFKAQSIPMVTFFGLNQMICAFSHVEKAQTSRPARHAT